MWVSHGCSVYIDDNAKDAWFTAPNCSVDTVPLIVMERVSKTTGFKSQRNVSESLPYIIIPYRLSECYTLLVVAYSMFMHSRLLSRQSFFVRIRWMSHCPKCGRVWKISRLIRFFSFTDLISARETGNCMNDRRPQVQEPDSTEDSVLSAYFDAITTVPYGNSCR